jgi:hypothetical protein
LGTLSPVPDVGEMARKSAWHNEDGVDADIVVFAGVTRCQPLGGDNNPPQPIRVKRQRQPFLGTASLDLDESERPAPSGNQVDLAASDPGALGEDAPPAQPQPPGRKPFGAPAALLSIDAPVQRLSSSARA